jgi:hypothetical protein
MPKYRILDLKLFAIGAAAGHQGGRGIGFSANQRYHMQRDDPARNAIDQKGVEDGMSRCVELDTVAQELISGRWTLDESNGIRTRRRNGLIPQAGIQQFLVACHPAVGIEFMYAEPDGIRA